MKNTSPIVNASFISTMMKERNPFLLFTREIARMVQVITNLKKNMQASNSRIEQLQSQVERIEGYIDNKANKKAGSKLNTFR